MNNPEKTERITQQFLQHRFYKHFQDICRIPHGSGDEKAISDHVACFAADLGLEVIQDSALNVIVKKPGTPGYENAPPVVLQCHLDMVCEKEPGLEHNFATDPIQTEIRDGFLTAKGTTLGADNGNGICYIMCVLEDKSLSHPPLEAVFTADEEVGMGGMAALDVGLLAGRRMVNLDSSNDQVLVASCAGGVRYEMQLPIKRQALAPDHIGYKLSVQGLQGGHSGGDIHTGRANANLLLARILGALSSRCQVRLCHLLGGEKANSIPTYAYAVLAATKEEADAIGTEVQSIAAVLQKEYGDIEPEMHIAFEPGGNAEPPLADESLQTLLSVLRLIPNGAFAHSPGRPNATISSSNLGVIRTHNGHVEATGLTRGNMDSMIDDTVARLKHLASLAGAEISIGNAYPAWEYRQESPLREACLSVYGALFGKQMEVESIHGGLECALMAGKCPDMDMVAIGPNLLDCHSPSERVEISSLLDIYEYLCKVLTALQ